jgi:M3 family oligoendopeptidase
MAEIGESTFTSLAYRRLGRLDYTIDDVRALREQIRETVHRDGAVMPWDESVFEPMPEMPSRIPVDLLVSRLVDALKSVSPEIAVFVQNLRDRCLMDIDDRPGKAPGAFCEQLPHLGMPFVFANATGTPENAITVAHEIGHAFQFYKSQRHRMLDLMIPTNETAEIHSLSLEFLLWPHFAALTDDADRFRQAHLRKLVLMLPYIAAVDHFQELVYEHPQANLQERRAMWRDMEARYMPWRRHGDIPALAAGRAWQAQRHIYRFPFYYIDYAIALCCALQLWQESQHNYGAAVDRYLELCRIGGSLPLKELLRATGLRSPFEHGLTVASIFSIMRTAR